MGMGKASKWRWNQDKVYQKPTAKTRKGDIGKIVRG